jgi:hypothetical protein
MKYFLLVYDQRSGLIEPPREFPGSSVSSALEQRFELERSYRDHPDIEVVVLSAQSTEDLKRTHARYFKSVRELATAG